MTSTLRKAAEQAIATLGFADWVLKSDARLTATSTTRKDIADTLDALNAALSAPEQDDGWLPIVSAPKEHSPILVWSLAGGCSVSFLDATWAWWSIPNGDGPMQDAPTHWRPLPASPGATP